ncbi:MAG: monovalent cation/H(+) antiporter subunit G [Candidatus Izemoplasmatales bacterium]|jgi:multicomponent Na+:H+ antiporter subunit G|nr:monovalent cation/H(+) antiporter subunit G [bacterium]MDZ4196154.1 monovalent cation/H(+) antiporter subunit G [Candidatus Izemoplasmatales bacterium]
MTIIGYVLLIFSWIFLLFGMIAIFRLRNIFSRIISATTIDTVAAILVIFALFFFIPSFAYAIRLVLLILFLFITNPISSHVIVRSAHLTGISIKDQETGGKIND